MKLAGVTVVVPRDRLSLWESLKSLKREALPTFPLLNAETVTCFSLPVFAYFHRS